MFHPAEIIYKKHNYNNNNNNNNNNNIVNQASNVS